VHQVGKLIYSQFMMQVRKTSRFNYSLPVMQHARHATHTHEYQRSLYKHLHLNYDLRIKAADLRQTLRFVDRAYRYKVVQI